MPKTIQTQAFFSLQEPRSIGAQLHQHLRAAIICGELSPGFALSETEMSKRYGVSRQPIREAFIKLAEEHLVSIIPQRGTYVLKISMSNVLDAQFMREALEVAIVREAALKAKGTHIKQLQSLVDQQKNIAYGNNHGFWLLDEAFHQTIAQSAGRESAWRVLESIKAQMDRVRYLSVDDATPTALLILHHQNITDAIAMRDPDLAEAALSHHLREILNSLPKISKTYSEFFDLK
ncbi:transcriptional repressor [Gammaproteobacteria bacterium]|nr:transcriptional repressor [Gammaproteobacteria bacterium]